MITDQNLAEGLWLCDPFCGHVIEAHSRSQIIPAGKMTKLYYQPPAKMGDFFWALGL